jgi:low temperature requirement protein LtrA
MTELETTVPSARPWHVPMTGRDADEEHRASTPLELLFDLSFVVAVSQAGAALHHDLAAGNVGHAIISYLTVFFAIWWPWVNFTWVKCEVCRGRSDPAALGRPHIQVDGADLRI